MGPIGIFGGTFDPIHYGHLRTAFELLEDLSLAEIRFVPCAQQPLRGRTIAPAETRLQMVHAAIEQEPRFSVDRRELDRPGPSYSVDTLIEIRAENPDRPLCLLLGMDAFLSLPEWHRWDELVSLAHVVVAHRPGWEVPSKGVLGQLLGEHGAQSFSDIHASRSGRILVTPVTQLEVAATELRRRLRNGDDLRYLTPDAVREIISETGIYMSDATGAGDA